MWWKIYVSLVFDKSMTERQTDKLTGGAADARRDGWTDGRTLLQIYAFEENILDETSIGEMADCAHCTMRKPWQF